MWVRTPNYVLSVSMTLSMGSHEKITMAAGSFVRPIHLGYVPKHVIDDPRWKDFDPRFEVFCFCRYGIIPFTKSAVRNAE